MTRSNDPELSRRAALTVKFLAADAVQRANSGHPGLPMGAAQIATVLWTRYLRYDPTAPDWVDRDRFVLSAGHGCALLYGLLHLAGYDLPMSELQAFRQWGSKTPGHPEFGHTVGVEATTGPLGQGISNAVGMALSARMLADRFNGKDDFDPVSHRVFVLASDGDLQEGISGEACSLGGHLGLGNLVVLYDDNRITIEGATDLAWSEDVGKRYESYGWHVGHADGHDDEAIAAAIESAVAVTDRPSIICCRTTIAHGAPTKAGTSASHGSPLGDDEIRGAKEAADWPLEAFHVPDDVREFFGARAREGADRHATWSKHFAEWRSANSELAAQWDAICDRTVPAGLTRMLLDDAPAEAGATRAHGGVVLQKAAELVPALAGGSADLAPSTKTVIKDSPAIRPGDFSGRNLHFGIREHGMGAIVNGMLYHGAWRPYGATFLVFSDYMRGSVRLSALAELPAIWVFTHDSIFVGEDGPTHEPIEHAAALRAIPNLNVFRPADGLETALAYGSAIERTDGPTALLLTRQKLPPIDRTAKGDLADPARGGYLVSAVDGTPDAILAATGSELHLAVAARDTLASEGKKLNLVSIPCLEILREQGDDYMNRLFPAGVPVATLEAGITAPWCEIAGRDGLRIGIDTFGASAPADVLAEKFGLTADQVTEKVRSWLS